MTDEPKPPPATEAKPKDAKSDWAAIGEELAKPVAPDAVIKLHHPVAPDKILKK